MSGQEVLLSACSEAAETWHYMARECEAFNKDSGIETAGQVARSLITFGTSAIISIPEIQRRIENHIIRLERSLYELLKRVSRCSGLASEDDNIFEMLIQVERKKFGAQHLLSCGFTGSESDRAYRCNIGEVSFHLLEARSFWGSASNSVQDIAQRHKMVCRSRRLLEEGLPTPKLVTMPYTPISKKLKDYIDSQIKAQVGNIDELAATAITSLKEAGKTSPLLQRLLTPETIGALKKTIEERSSSTSSDKASAADGNVE
jgi:hypothetical protein